MKYSEVIAQIRPQLGPGCIIKLTQNGQVIPQNTSDKLGGEIGCIVQGLITSVTPSSRDELCRGLQELIHVDFFNLYSRPDDRCIYGNYQFHHINATRVVDSAPWVEEVDEGGNCLNTGALQSDVIKTLKVLCDNIDNKSNPITKLRGFLAQTPVPLQFEFSRKTRFPNIIQITIKTPPEYHIRDLAFLDQDGNLVLQSYKDGPDEWAE